MADPIHASLLRIEAALKRIVARLPLPKFAPLPPGGEIPFDEIHARCEAAWAKAERGEMPTEDDHRAIAAKLILRKHGAVKWCPGRGAGCGYPILPDKNLCRTCALPETPPCSLKDAERQWRDAEDDLILLRSRQAAEPSPQNRDAVARAEHRERTLRVVVQTWRIEPPERRREAMKAAMEKWGGKQYPTVAAAEAAADEQDRLDDAAGRERIPRGTGFPQMSADGAMMLAGTAKKMALPEPGATLDRDRSKDGPSPHSPPEPGNWRPKPADRTHHADRMAAMEQSGKVPREDWCRCGDCRTRRGELAR